LFAGRISAGVPNDESKKATGLLIRAAAMFTSRPAVGIWAKGANPALRHYFGCDRPGVGCQIK
jgi:hypothetical protein